MVKFANDELVFFSAGMQNILLKENQELAAKMAAQQKQLEAQMAQQLQQQQQFLAQQAMRNQMEIAEKQ